MWRSMMNRKIMIVDVAEDEMEVDDVEDHEVKEEEDDDVEDDHVEAQDGTHTLREPAQSQCTWTCHKSHFLRNFTGKMPCPKTAAQTLCEPAQSKRMSRFYTRRFIRKFTGNRPQKRVTTLIKHQPLHLPSEPLSVDTLSGEECFYILAAK